MITLVLKLIMKVYNLLTGTVHSYQNAPQEFITDIRKHWLERLWHLVPTFILGIMTTVKFLPGISSTVNKQVQSNSSIVIVYAIISIFTMGLLVGWAIEVYLEITVEGYRESKKKR